MLYILFLCFLSLCLVPLIFPHSDSNFVLGNAQVQSLYPIVYCSDGFCELTGFARGELMQKSCMCHFLYGSETSERLTSQMQIALDGRQEFKTEIVLYKKSGETGWLEDITFNHVQYWQRQSQIYNLLVKPDMFRREYSNLCTLNRLQVLVSAGHCAHKEREERSGSVPGLT